MGGLTKKEISRYIILVLIEAIAICKWLMPALIVCILVNNVMIAISCGKATSRLVDMLRDYNPLLYRRHPIAMDSNNILTIKSALRGETLREEEQKAMQVALGYVKVLLVIDAVLLVVLVVAA